MRIRKNLAFFLAFIGAVVLLITSVQPPSEANAAKGNLKLKKLEVDEFFTNHDGTFILRDTKKEKSFIYNNERANQRYAPQSTFKVPNSLIGLQVGAVEDEYDIKYWDGVEREIEVWNQDHTLGSAMRNSVVWYYQAMARDIGYNRMDEWVQNISYGNQDISGGIDQFWLSSSLKISPIEQADFMETLYKENLSFDKDVMKTVKRMMIQKEGDNYTLYGKTGQGSGIGWYVGFIETDNRTYSFATNIAGTSTDAKNITMDILKKYNLMAE
ncbi:class D beta-lactamase [Bacillus canaveralius]|uniref:Beta-lactamase n=1 Tax=Bacillus canaveralius TaxID=1403243 RepID=A0A2N5GG85_9BACI|nr:MULTISPECIES: class D beta-lactamase [Bacillus]PLR79735.1 class D beta-lactamase [Bacillus canaveralius]PLR87231.1 class D beta-lactamase [Bacillus sp. V33-4]PLR88953.1 class D beta-lactamase [Bacillus canaveralius]RSK47094.1 class D beta-lactamase [Bacillus canaveralius]